jgi:prepilin-type N-terminal cleavage/methylation domain-containing protein
MVKAWLLARGKKAGYTLVEVLVVVSIMGVLSAMGVAGLQRAVANARIKDAAVNTAAFVERVANESMRLSTVLCLKIEPGNPQKVLVVKDDGKKDCSSPKDGVIDFLEIDSPNKFVSMSKCGPVTLDWFGNNKQVAFKPRLGLAATPPEGGVCIQYGDKDIYGAVRKDPGKNWVIPMWKVSHDGSQDSDWSNWTEL